MPDTTKRPPVITPRHNPYPRPHTSVEGTAIRTQLLAAGWEDCDDGENAGYIYKETWPEDGYTGRRWYRLTTTEGETPICWDEPCQLASYGHDEDGDIDYDQKEDESFGSLRDLARAAFLHEALPTDAVCWIDNDELGLPCLAPEDVTCYAAHVQRAHAVIGGDDTVYVYFATTPASAVEVATSKMWHDIATFRDSTGWAVKVLDLHRIALTDDGLLEMDNYTHVRLP